METNLAISGGNPVREELLHFAHPVLGEDEIEEVVQAIESGWLTTGPKTAEFEDEISQRVGAGYCVGTTNCTSALYLGYRSLDIKGEIITTPLTFASTVSSAKLAGANPVLADIRKDTLTLDPEAVKEKITEKTEAIVPVHYAGQAADMDAFQDLAADHNLAIIEDAAHALGGLYEGSPLGTLGDLGCYSFYATKSITTGEGGMLVTDDEEIANTSERLRLAGVDKDAWAREGEKGPDWYYDVKEVSGKYNMNDIQASIGLAQLQKLDSFIQTRQQIADALDEELRQITGISTLAVRDRTEHARHLYPILIDTEMLDTTRQEFNQALNAEGIETSVHYIPIYEHSAFTDLYNETLCTSEQVKDQIICLPLHPMMKESDVRDTAEAVQKVASKI